MGHFKLGKMAAAAGVRNLVISHVTEQFDGPGMREQVVRDIGSVYEGNIFFGEDLMEIPVDGPRATKLD